MLTGQSLFGKTHKAKLMKLNQSTKFILIFFVIPLNLCICLLEGPKRFNFKENEVVVSLHVLLHSSVSGRFLLPAPVEADHLKRGVTKNCIYDL